MLLCGKANKTYAVSDAIGLSQNVSLQGSHYSPTPTFHKVFLLRFGQDNVAMHSMARAMSIRCGHVVRDFESEAKTRCNF